MSFILDKLDNCIKENNFKKKVRTKDVKRHAFSIYESLVFSEEDLDILSTKVLKFPNAVYLLTLTLKNIINNKETALNSLLENMDEMLDESLNDKLENLEAKISKTIIREFLNIHDHLQTINGSITNNSLDLDKNIYNNTIKIISELVPIITKDVIEDTIPDILSEAFETK